MYETLLQIYHLIWVGMGLAVIGALIYNPHGIKPLWRHFEVFGACVSLSRKYVNTMDNEWMNELMIEWMNEWMNGVLGHICAQIG